MQYQKSNTTFLSGCVRYVEVISFAGKECLKCGFYCLLEYFGAYPMWPLVYIQHIQHSPIFSQVMNGHFTNVYQSINTQQKRSRLKRSSLIACFAYIISIPA